MQPINASASPEVQMNENFQTIAWASVYGNDPTLTFGLTRGYYGGRWGGFLVAGSTLTLTNTADNYLVVHKSDGALSVSTTNTNWNDTTNYARVYKLTTAGGVVTVEEDHRAGPYGSGGTGVAGAGGAAGISMALAFTSDTSSQADSDPGNGLFRWNNATQASATVLYLDNLTLDGVTISTFWASLGPTGFIHLIQADDSTKWQLWKWTATPVNGTGYYKFTVTLQAASAGAIATAKTVYALFTNTGVAGTVDLTSTQHLSGKRIDSLVVSAASYTTDTGTSLSWDTCEEFVITAQAGALKFNNPSGTPTPGQSIVIRIKDNGTARALTWDTQYRALGTPLPSTTVLSKTLYLAFFWNTTDTKVDLVGSAQEA